MPCYEWCARLKLTAAVSMTFRDSWLPHQQPQGGCLGAPTRCTCSDVAMLPGRLSKIFESTDGRVGVGWTGSVGRAPGEVL